MMSASDVVFIWSRSLAAASSGRAGALMRRDGVRRLALGFPEAVELETWGTPTFRVRKRIFVMLSEGQKEAWVKSTHDEQRALIAMDPETFFVPPYVGPSGWVGIRIRTVDPDEMRELVTEAWRLTAPARLVRAFDQRDVTS
jgi:hypothetical protein